MSSPSLQRRILILLRRPRPLKYREIAQLTGTNIAAVAMVAKLNGIVRMPHRKPADIARMVARARAGEYYDDIAASYGVTGERIRKIASLNGVPARRDPLVTAAALRKIAAAAGSYRTVSELARAFKVSHSTAARALRFTGKRPPLTHCFACHAHTVKGALFCPRHSRERMAYSLAKNYFERHPNATRVLPALRRKPAAPPRCLLCRAALAPRGKYLCNDHYDKRLAQVASNLRLYPLAQELIGRRFQ